MRQICINIKQNTESSTRIFTQMRHQRHQETLRDAKGVYPMHDFNSIRGKTFPHLRAIPYEKAATVFL